MGKRVLVAGILQYCPEWQNPEKNIEKIRRMLPNNMYADLVVLPEMFLTGYSTDASNAIDMENSLLLEVCYIAKKYGTYICGSLMIKEGGKIYNRFIVFGAEGRIVDYYDKHFLFPLTGEDKVFTPGQFRKIIEIETGGGKIKLMPCICYEVRFAPWIFNDMDYDILVVVSAWPQERIKAWENLLKARAIENQCYVIGVNTWGKSPDGSFYGGVSTITCPPNGEYMIPPLHGEMFSSVVLDINYLETIREKYPFLKSFSFTIKSN